MLFHQVQKMQWAKRMKRKFMKMMPLKVLYNTVTLISHKTFTSSFSTTACGTCSYYFSICSNPFFLQNSRWTFFATLSCRLLYSFWANFSQSDNKCCTLSPFFPHILHRGFHWSYRCSTLHSLSWWPVPVLHIATLLSLNLQITFG